MMLTKTMMMLIDADSAIYCTQRDSLIASLHLRAPIFYFLLIFQFAEYDTIRYTLFTCAKKLTDSQLFCRTEPNKNTNYGCIVWNAHNTVLGSKRLAICATKWACPKITSGQSNLT